MRQPRTIAVLVLLVLLLAASVAHALEPDRAFHHYVRDSWSVQEGLPQISALALAQDADGYIWIGTQGGLAQFDGVRFIAHTPRTHPALPGMYVQALHAAADGRLWIGTYKGVAVREGTGLAAVAAADPARWPTLDVFGFDEDAGGRIWVATSAGLFRAGGGRLHAVPGSPLQANAVLAHAGHVWVGTPGVVHRLHGKAWEALPLPAEAADAPVHELLEAQGSVWAATDAGLFLRSQGAWQRLPAAPQLSGVAINLLLADSDGNLWVGSDTGLARIRGGRLVEYIDAAAPGGIAGLRSGIEDREGNLWLGSQWESLLRVADGWARRFSSADGLDNPIVWSVSPDPDGRRVWVGSNDGVSVLDRGRFRTVVSGAALPHSAGYNLLAEADRLWIGTRRGLAVIDHAGPLAGKVRQPERFSPMASAQISAIVREEDVLWFATTEGLFRWQDDRLRHYAEPDGLADPRMRHLFRTAEGRLLAGTQGGLFEMRGERFVPVGADAGLPADLDVSVTHQLPDRRLVVGSTNEQLYFEHAGRWHLLEEAHGIRPNAPTAMFSIDGYLWMAGFRGITRLPIADLAPFAQGRVGRVAGEMLLSDRGDPNSGQQGFCCNGAGNHKGFQRDGVLWLPSRDGVVAMGTRDIVRNPVPPRPVIERVLVAGQWQDATALHGTRLPGGARDLDVEFSVLSLQDPKSTTVQYRLGGYDRAWRDADPLNRNTRYTNLPPGEYVFEVRGSNNAGVASAGTATLPFSIRPHFHETGWFIALLVATALLVMYGVYRYQRLRHRRHSRALEVMVRQRTSALETSHRELEQANGKLEQATLTDPLTGLRNRRYISNQIPTDLAYYDRRIRDGDGDAADQVLVFVLIDIDHFKAVNDTHGHRAGDVVLQQVAAVLTAMVRTGDYVVRWGGEEFLLVFRPMPMEQLAVLGERIRAAIGGHRFDIGEGNTLRLTASTGMAEYPLFRRSDGASLGWEAMVELADLAMYHVKTHGRDGWAAYRPTPRTNIDTVLAELQHDAGALVAAGRVELVGSDAASAVHP